MTNLIYELVIDRVAMKFLAKQDRNTVKRLRKGLEGLRTNPPIGDIKKMKGDQGVYRLRIGTFRVIFSVNEQTKQIFIERIGNRGDIYK